MLQEISNIQQKAQGKFRRWFTDNNMDLFVWFSHNVPVGFQLSYNKQADEKSICWDAKTRFQHYTIDTGETEPLNYKETPMCLFDDEFDMDSVAPDFLHRSAQIESSLAAFIYERIMEYPHHQGTHSNQDAVLSSC